MTHAQEHRRSRRPGSIDLRLYGTSPLSVPNCRLWFRADSLALVDGDLIDAWSDESGYGTNAVSAGANRPTFKTNIVNGLPVVRCAGNHWLDHGALFLPYATYFVVWSRTGAANNDYILGASGAAYSYLQYGGSWYVYKNISTAVAMATGTFMLKCNRYNGTTYQRYTNGVAEASQAGAGGANLRYIGAGGFACNGDIAEVIIYQTALTDAERSIVDLYLRLKYALW